MNLAELTPDIELKQALEGNINLQISAEEIVDVKVYANAEQPNVGLDDAFICITPNGSVQSMTIPSGMYKGNVAIAIYCKSSSDGTAKTNRIRQMLAQIGDLVERKTTTNFFFKFSTYSVITPITVDIITGYATTVVSLEWRTR